MEVSEKRQSGNPIIRHKYTCDPTALVVDDKVYLYTGHDEAPTGIDDYVMNEWLCFSSQNLVDWTEHPSPLKAIDFDWASGDAYASKVICKDGKYFLYVSVTHGERKGKAIGVAVANRPEGPYHDAIGKALITHDMLPVAKNEKANLDPTVLVDDDGKAYLFWGNGNCYYARLKENMTELDNEIQVVDLPGFKEGSHLHKRDGWYYLSYGYSMPEKVAYAMSQNIEGPWEYKGILNEVVANCETNRPCIIDFKGQSYFFYHNGELPGGSSHRRSVCVEYLNYNEDGTIKKIIMTTEGIDSVV